MEINRYQELHVTTKVDNQRFQNNNNKATTFN